MSSNSVGCAIDVGNNDREVCMHNLCSLQEAPGSARDPGKPALRLNTILQIATRVSFRYGQHLRADVRSAAVEAMLTANLHGAVDPTAVLYTVARRAAYWEARRDRCHHHEDFEELEGYDEPAHDPSQAIEHELHMGEMRADLLAALPKLPGQHALCVLGALTGRTLRMIGRELGTSNQAVSRMQNAALLELGLLL